MPKIFIVLVCLLALPVSLFGKTADINLPAIIKICESFEKAVTDVNIEYTFEFNDPKSKQKVVGSPKGIFTAIKPFDKFYKSIQLYILEDEKGNRHATQIDEACDGNTYKLPKNFESDKKNFDYSSTPLGFTIFSQLAEPKTVSDILKDRSKYNLIYDPNIIKVNDFNAIEIVCFPAASYMTPKFKFSFSVDHNYTLVKIVGYLDSQSHTADYNVTQLKDLGNDIWFPTKGIYIFNDTGFIRTFIVSSVAINQGLTKKNLLDTQKQDVNSPPQKN